MIFVNRQRKVEERLEQYRLKVGECVAGMKRSLQDYAGSGDRGRLREDYAAVHHLESEADDLRREIEYMMYSRTIFPESRGDILGLVEAVDKVPNQAEKVLQLILTHGITIPGEFTDSFVQLAALAARCADSLLVGMEKLFTDFVTATSAVGRTDELESQSDHAEMALIERVFDSQLEPLVKLGLRDLVVAIGSVCDRSENAGDRIRIIVAKRKV